MENGTSVLAVQSAAGPQGQADGGVLAGVNAERMAIRVERLDAFYGKKQVLKQVGFSAGAHGVTALIGPSGCGKTTLLRTLNRMNDGVGGFHTAGSIRIFGEDLARIRDVESFRRRVGMLFQRPNPFPMSIFDNVTLALRLSGMGRSEREGVAESALQEVGLWEEVKDRLRHSPGTLSGGQQQRLCLARALAVRPEILLLDEPASALDPKSTRVLEDLFVRLGERMAIVLVTHNLAQARRAAAFTGFMQDGELLEFRPTEELFSNPSDPRTRIYVEEQIG